MKGYPNTEEWGRKDAKRYAVKGGDAADIKADRDKSGDLPAAKRVPMPSSPMKVQQDT